MRIRKRFMMPALLGIFIFSIIAASPTLSTTGIVRFYDPSDTSEDQEWTRQGGLIGLEVEDDDLNIMSKLVHVPNASAACGDDDNCIDAEEIILNNSHVIYLSNIPVLDSGVSHGNVIEGDIDSFVNEYDVRLVDADGFEVTDSSGNSLVDRLSRDGRVDLTEDYTGTVYAIYWGSGMDDTDAAVRVRSQADPSGITVVLEETRMDSGVFRLVIGADDDESDADSNPPSLQVGEDDVVTLTYRDEDTSQSVSKTLKVETTAPVFSNLLPAHDSASRVEPTVEFFVADGGSGIAESDIWVIFAIDENEDGIIDANDEYEFQVSESGKGDVDDEDNSVFNVFQGIPNSVDVGSDATIYWWALARDLAGNLAVLDREPRIDGKRDTCYVADFPRGDLAGGNVNRSHFIAGCQPYVVRIDNTGPVMERVITGRWWDTSKKDDDKTEYDSTKARNDSILVDFSEEVDASTIQPTDFRVDGKVPLKAEVFDGRGDYVFLTVSAFAPDARPSVEVVGNVQDLAGNRVGSGGKDNDDETPTPDVPGPGGNGTDQGGRDGDDETPTPDPAPPIDSLEFLIDVLREARAIGVLSDTLSDLLSDWFIVNLIAPDTGEFPDEVRNRLSAQ